MHLNGIAVDHRGGPGHVGQDYRVDTQLFNGYGEFVAELYTGLEDEKLYM